MRRCAFALIAAVLTAAAAPAMEPLKGNWQLVSIGPAAETTLCILKAEVKDGKPCATVVDSPPNVETEIVDFRVTDSAVNITVRQVRTTQARKTITDTQFIGVRGSDKVILGGSKQLSADDRTLTRARLVATDKAALAVNAFSKNVELPGPMEEARKLNSKAAELYVQFNREYDADKWKELQRQYTAARKEAREKSPALYHESVAEHGDHPSALDAALGLARSGPPAKLTATEADQLVAVVRKHGEPHGPYFAAVTLAQLAEALNQLTGVQSAALAAARRAAELLAEDSSPSAHSLVLAAYVTTLEKNGTPAEAKLIAERLAIAEKKLDEAYLAKVPPFKPEPFAGRKTKGANQVVVLELFTGAQCPPCVATDVAFDALGRAYKPSELVLIQYHMHIPDADPMVNPACVARFEFYKGKWGSTQAMRGTPSTLFNGKRDGGMGSGMANAESKFKLYRGIIEPLLEKSSPITLGPNCYADRRGDKIDIAVEVSGVEPADELKLRLVLVEEVVKFVGGNSLRFHHHVVRAMPGGAEGATITATRFTSRQSVDIVELRQDLDKYLTSYAEKKPFPLPGRPMEMKNLKVIAFVQDDKTGEILQGVQLDVESK